MLTVFTIFVALLMKKNQTQSFSLAPLKLLTSVEILLVTCFQDPKAVILTLKMLKGAQA